MNAVAHLASLLAPSVRIAGLSMESSGDIDDVIETLERRVKSGVARHVPSDLQGEVLQRFWQRPELETLGAARIVAFALGVATGPEGTCLLDDTTRLDAAFAQMDRWLARPRLYRRCYQGLMWSYFRFDVEVEDVTKAARANAVRLRDYLKARAPMTVDGTCNPEWVDVVARSPHLFGDAPTQIYAADLLSGHRAEVDSICKLLGIDASSWFRRKLVEAQFVAASRFDNDAFLASLPTLVDLLDSAGTFVNRGLAMLLERYAGIADAPPNGALRDAAAAHWGVPWATSTALNWSATGIEAREMAAGWLKDELIESFFLLQSGGGGRRRADFWKRYAASSTSVDFAFGASAKGGGLQRVRGLGVPLQGAAHDTDCAMVLTIGSALIVTFLDPEEPVFAYDLRKGLPFDIGQPVAFARDAERSLRRSTRDLELPYRDGLEGWRRWEQMFEAAMKDRFDTRSGALASATSCRFVDLSDDAAMLANLSSSAGNKAPVWHQASAGEDVHWQTAEAASVPYSRPDLEVLARVHSLRIEDLTARGGKLWVRSEPKDARLEQILRRWGFARVAGSGWCK